MVQLPPHERVKERTKAKDNNTHMIVDIVKQFSIREYPTENLGIERGTPFPLIKASGETP